MMAANWLWIATGLGLVVSIAAIGIWWNALRDSLEKAPKLGPIATIPDRLPSITVIIPAYNEALNIQGCLRAVLQNKLPPDTQLQVIVADDESTDETAALAQAIAANDARITVITVPPRPTTAIWRGKNWACAQAVQQATGEYWLFIDADVRLEPSAIATTLTEAQQQQSDLLSLGPEVICGCLAEWLVQPLMLSLIVIGFKFDGVNDPNAKDTAFAAGMFMLFKKTWASPNELKPRATNSATAWPRASSRCGCTRILRDFGKVGRRISTWGRIAMSAPCFSRPLRC
jgi:Glycosyl transferase family 2